MTTSSSLSSSARALHYVFRIANRAEAISFYKNVLEMRVLRHEEFEERCQADCNGPYDGMWSKTMIGYGPEDDNFVLELTYNYGVKQYRNGNDFNRIFIDSETLYKKLLTDDGAAAHKRSILIDQTTIEVTDPDGHVFCVRPIDSTTGNEVSTPKITKISLNATDLEKSKEFWCSLCGMKIISNIGKIENHADDSVIFCFASEQCKLELCLLPPDHKMDRGTAFGRIAFSTPTSTLAVLEKRASEANPRFVLTPLKSLDTPGKATVSVVILQDPDLHEVCFVGNEGFRELSAVDPFADSLIQQAISKDRSDECC